MKYILLSYVAPGGMEALSEDEQKQWWADDDAWNKMLAEKDCVVVGEPLEEAATATTVRVVDGEPTLTDGPYAETAEQLGGILVIDVADLDEALAIAKQCPAARLGPLEVRPLRPHPR
jgi:hypothetical protein